MKIYLVLAAITLGVFSSAQATLVIKSEGELGPGTTNVEAGDTLAVEGNQTIGGLKIAAGGVVVFGKAPPNSSTSPIPEPTSALFGLALCGFAAMRRRH